MVPLTRKERGVSPAAVATPVYVWGSRAVVGHDLAVADGAGAGLDFYLLIAAAGGEEEWEEDEG